MFYVGKHVKAVVSAVASEQKVYRCWLFCVEFACSPACAHNLIKLLLLNPL